MEELLQQVVKEATGTKLMNLKNASQNAHGKRRQHQITLYFCWFKNWHSSRLQIFQSIFLSHSQFADKLYRQHGIHRDPSYELRAVCLTAIQMALETKRAKFITLALNGMHVSPSQSLRFSFRFCKFIHSTSSFHPIVHDSALLKMNDFMLELSRRMIHCGCLHNCCALHRA